jgi:hypothetical protein
MSVRTLNLCFLTKKHTDSFFGQYCCCRLMRSVRLGILLDARTTSIVVHVICVHSLLDRLLYTCTSHFHSSFVLGSRESANSYFQIHTVEMDYSVRVYAQNSKSEGIVYNCLKYTPSVTMKISSNGIFILLGSSRHSIPSREQSTKVTEVSLKLTIGTAL